MSDPFENKLSTAVQAGWRVCLISYLVVVFVWITYLFVFGTPNHAWYQSLWPGADWSMVQGISWGALVLCKLIAWFFILVEIWLALWLKLYRRQS